MDTSDVPNVPLELLEYLVITYPNTLPKKDVPSFELGKLVGIQELIEHLYILRASK